MVVSRVKTVLDKPFMPAVFFLAGVTYDSVTLTRIDRLLDNLILLLYLSLLGFLIVLMGRFTVGQMPDGPSTGVPPALSVLGRARPYYPMAIQFLLGGLFSAYAIFYLQSASLSTTAIFFGVLVILLVANEFLRDRLSNLRLLVTLYAVVCFSFFTLFLPVITGLMHWALFLLGAALSGLVTLRVVELVYRGKPNVPRKEVVLTSLPAIALIVVLIGFYFLNWIPPVPLSLKFGGTYRQVAKEQDLYRLSFEEGAWYQFWKRSDDPFRGEGPVSCFTAVFAPVNLTTTIYHHWQYRAFGAEGSRGAGAFRTTDRIPIPISGGREGGYRGYTTKQRLLSGDWQVDVETTDGRLIGRVGFRVEERGGDVPLQLESITY